MVFVFFNFEPTSVKQMEQLPPLNSNEVYVVLDWDAGQDRCHVKVFTTIEKMIAYFKRRSWYDRTMSRADIIRTAYDYYTIRVEPLNP